jgi:hypothetical protein
LRTSRTSAPGWKFLPFSVTSEASLRWKSDPGEIFETLGTNAVPVGVT